MDLDPWTTPDYPTCGPNYSNNAFSCGPPDMFYDTLGPDMPTPSPFQLRQQPSQERQNSHYDKFAPFRHNFMYFEPRPQPLPMFSGLGDNWYKTGLHRLMLDDAMYFGGGVASVEARGTGVAGAGCQAGWLPDSNRDWATGLDTEMTPAPDFSAPSPAMLSPPTSTTAWQRRMTNYGHRQLLPDI